MFARTFAKRSRQTLSWLASSTLGRICPNLSAAPFSRWPMAASNSMFELFPRCLFSLRLTGPIGPPNQLAQKNTRNVVGRFPFPEPAPFVENWPTESRVLGNVARGGPDSIQDKDLRRQAPALARILHADADLNRLVAAWPTLPAPIRAAMLVLLGSATGATANAEE